MVQIDSREQIRQSRKEERNKLKAQPAECILTTMLVARMFPVSLLAHCSRYKGSSKEQPSSYTCAAQVRHHN